MDPLISVVQELKRATEEVAKYEDILSERETCANFDATDPCYRALVLKKQVLLRSVMDLRIVLTHQGEVWHF